MDTETIPLRSGSETLLEHGSVMFNFLKVLASEAVETVEMHKKKRANFGLKMELFEAETGLRVVDRYPVDSDHGVDPPGSQYPRYYVRELFDNSATTFYWCNTETGAELLRDRLLVKMKSGNVGSSVRTLSVIGPHPLPWGPDSRFR